MAAGPASSLPSRSARFHRALTDGNPGAGRRPSRWEAFGILSTPAAAPYPAVWRVRGGSRVLRAGKSGESLGSGECLGRSSLRTSEETWETLRKLNPQIRPL